MKPRIIVASANAKIDIPAALQLSLEQRHGYLVTVWDQGVFGLSRYPVPALLSRAKVSDFAIIVVGQDEMRARPDGTLAFVPNSNVILECGLFFGALGLDRVFILIPAPENAPVELPSDLNGLTVARYDANREDGNLDAALGSAVRQISREIGGSWKQVRIERARTGRVAYFETFNSDFERLTETCSSLELCFIHSRRWRESHGHIIKQRLRTGDIKSLKLFLPDAQNGGFMTELAMRFSDGPVIPSMVYDAYAWVRDVTSGSAAQPQIWLFSRLPSFTFYKFDTEAIVALYPLATVKKPVPSICVVTGSETWDFLESDIVDFEAECRPATSERLEVMCNKFKAHGQF